MKKILEQIRERMRFLTQGIYSENISDCYSDIIAMGREIAKYYESTVPKEEIEDLKQNVEKLKKSGQMKVGLLSKLMNDIRAKEFFQNLLQINSLKQENPEQFNLILLVNFFNNLAHYDNTFADNWYELKNVAMAELIKRFDKEKIFVQESAKNNAELTVFFEVYVEAVAEYFSWHTMKSMLPNFSEYDNEIMNRELRARAAEKARDAYDAYCVAGKENAMIDKYLRINNSALINKILDLEQNKKIKFSYLFVSRPKKFVRTERPQQSVHEENKNNEHKIREKRERKKYEKYPHPNEAEQALINILKIFNLEKEGSRDSIEELNEKIKNADFSKVNTVKDMPEEVIKLFKSLSCETIKDDKTIRIMGLIIGMNELIKRNAKRSKKDKDDYSLIKSYCNKLIDVVKENGKIVELKRSGRQYYLLIENVSKGKSVKLYIYPENGKRAISGKHTVYMTTEQADSIESSDILEIQKLFDVVKEEELSKADFFEGGGNYGIDVSAQTNVTKTTISTEEIQEYLLNEKEQGRLDKVLTSMSSEKKAEIVHTILETLSPDERFDFIKSGLEEFRPKTNLTINSTVERKKRGRPKGSKNRNKGEDR